MEQDKRGKNSVRLSSHNLLLMCVISNKYETSTSFIVLHRLFPREIFRRKPLIFLACKIIPPLFWLGDIFFSIDSLSAAWFLGILHPVWIIIRRDRIIFETDSKNLVRKKNRTKKFIKQKNENFCLRAYRLGAFLPSHIFPSILTYPSVTALLKAIPAALLVSLFIPNWIKTSATSGSVTPRSRLALQSCKTVRTFAFTDFSVFITITIKIKKFQTAQKRQSLN